MSVSFLKHYCNFPITFNVILRSISGTGKVDSVIIFNILEHPLEHPKIVSSLDLNKSTESTSTTALGKLFQISTILFLKIIGLMTSIFR